MAKVRWLPSGRGWFLVGGGGGFRKTETQHKPKSAFEPRKQIEIHKMFMSLEQFFIF